MDRSQLLSELHQYKGYNQEEEDFRIRLLQLIESEKDCFQRQLAHGHITGSALIINPAADRVLLLHHRKLDKWLQPGGHADGDENIRRVAEKEAFEETGLKSLRLAGPAILDLDIHRIPARKNEAEHLHYDIRYLFTADPEEPLRMNAESKELGWFLLKEVPARTGNNASINRMLDKVLHQKAIPHA